MDCPNALKPDAATPPPTAVAGLGRGVALTSSIAALLLGAYALLWLLPWQPSMPADSLDSSWQTVIAMALAKGWQFGSDIVFTFGPWGCISSDQYYPGLYRTVLLWRGLLVLIAVATIWRIGLGISRNLLWSRLAAVLVCWLFVAMAMHHCEVLYYMLLCQMLLLRFLVEPARPQPCGPAPVQEGRSAWIRLLVAGRNAWKGYHEPVLVIAVAMVSLIKFSYGVAAVASVLALAVDDVFRKRRSPWIVPLYAAALLTFWLLAGQRLWGLAAYVTNSLEIAAGYPEMALAPDARRVLWYRVTAVALLVMLIWAEWPQRRWRMILPLGAFCILLWLMIQASFVRHNGIMTIWLFPALVPLTCCTIWRHMRRIGRAFSLAACLLALAGPPMLLTESRLLSAWFPAPVDRLVAAGKVLRGSASCAQEYESWKERMRAALPLPPLAGTVDCYHWNVNEVVVNGLQYSPRPVFQSYCAYTSKLIELNAQHLLSPRASKYVIFDVLAIDSRYYSLDDSRSWLALLSRYEVSKQNRPECPSFILEQAPQPRPYELVPASEKDLQLDEPWEVPGLAAGPLWAEIDVAHTFAGTLAARTTRPPLVALRLLYLHDKESDFRLTLGPARSGFLLSPTVGGPRMVCMDRFDPLERPALATCALIVSSDDATHRHRQQVGDSRADPREALLPEVRTVAHGVVPIHRGDGVAVRIVHSASQGFPCGIALVAGPWHGDGLGKAFPGDPACGPRRFRGALAADGASSRHQVRRAE